MDTRKRNAQQNAWQAENTTRVYVKLNNRTDADILEALERQESKQGFIKACIREYLKRNQ